MHASFAPAASALNRDIEDIYANDICRTLSLIDLATSEDVIAHLKGLCLGDDFWMYSFKVVPCAKTTNHKWTLCPCGHQGKSLFSFLTNEPFLNRSKIHRRNCATPRHQVATLQGCAVPLGESGEFSQRSKKRIITRTWGLPA